MTVYVDDMNAPYGRMIMCHMLADTDDELHAMAARIGVARRWWQAPPHDSHYDICLSKRALAVKFGAVEIAAREAGAMNRRRRVTGILGSPCDAIEWRKTHTIRHGGVGQTSILAGQNGLRVDSNHQPNDVQAHGGQNSSLPSP